MTMSKKSKARRLDDDDDDDDDDEDVIEEEIILDDESLANDEVEEETIEEIVEISKKRKRSRQTTLTSAKKIKKKTKRQSSNLSDEKKKKLLEDGRRTARKEFEQHKEATLKRIPANYKAKFGQIGFTKWNKNLIPVLILSPFQVPPGEVRQTWESMFEKKLKANALSSMSYLIYWYGALDESSFFGFIAQSSFVPYEKEEAKGDKGCHILNPRILKKVNAKTPLNLKDKEKYNAHIEMEEDLKKKPSERRRGILNFPEVYDLLEIDDVEDISESSDDDGNNDDDSSSSDDGEELSDVSSVLAEKSSDTKASSEEQDTKPKHQPIKEKIEHVSSDETVQTGRKKGDINTFRDADSDSGVDMKSEKIPNKVKSGKIEKKKKIRELDEQDSEVDDVVRVSKPVKDKTAKGSSVKKNRKSLISTTGDSDSDTADDMDRAKKSKAGKRKKSFIVEEDDGSVPVHGENDDEGTKVKKPGRKKKIIVELDKRNELEKKSTNSSSTRKGMFDKPSVDVDDEQILLQECERRHLAKINRWKECLESKDTTALEVVISRVVKVISSFTAPFVQSYGVLALIKQTESMFPSGDDTLKILKSNLFRFYADKKENVPRGFKPVLGLVPINPWTEDESMDVDDANERPVKASSDVADKNEENSNVKQDDRPKDVQSLKSSTIDKEEKKNRVKTEVIEKDEEKVVKKEKKRPKNNTIVSNKKSSISAKAKRIDDDSDEEKEFDMDDEKDMDFSGDEESSSDENATTKKDRTEEIDGDRKRKAKDSESKMKTTAKVKPEKQMTERGKILKEHISFKSSQSKYLPLIDEWKASLESENTKKVLAVMEKTFEVVDDFSASFMEVYGVSNLLKGTKQLLKQNHEDLSSWSSLRDKLRTVYAEKSILVPKNFTPKLGDQEKIVKFEPRKEIETNEKSEASAGGGGDAKGSLKSREVAKTDNIPKSQSSNSLSANADIKTTTTISSSANNPVPPKKSSFSLGKFMKPVAKEADNKPDPTSSIPKSQSLSNINSSNRQDKKVVDVVPSWVKGPSSIDTPKDDPRLFALEFLLQMARLFPEGKINVDSVARSIEVAIYEWSTTKVENNRKSLLAMRKDAGSWTDRYWGKIHAIVAAICGKVEAGTLMQLIMKGQFDTPDKILDLSEDDLIASFEGRPLSTL